MARPRRRIAALAALVAVVVTVVATRSPNGPPSSSLPSPATPTSSDEPQVNAPPWSAVEWRLLDHPFGAADPAPIRIDGLAHGSGLLVGWGRVSTEGVNQFNEMGAVFVSADGERWRSIALANGVPVGDTSEPHGVSIGPLGYLAWGGVCCGIEESAIWRSDDGLHWIRAQIAGDLAAPGAGIVDVTGQPGGWVAVGAQGGQAAIWTSADGLRWQAVDSGAAGLGKGVVSDVARVGDRLIAVGTVDDDAATHDGAVWSSRDGLAWSRIAPDEPTLTGPDETELFKVVPHSGGLFVLGNHGLHQERVQCERLLGAVANLVDTGPPGTALSCGWGREHHWVSLDGTAWQRLPPLDPLPGQPPAPGLRPIEFRVLASGGPGLVDLGEDSRPPDGDTGVWMSADGATWQFVPSRGAALPAGAPMGVAIVDRRFVAVGERLDAGGRSRVGIWVGSVR